LVDIGFTAVYDIYLLCAACFRRVDAVFDFVAVLEEVTWTPSSLHCNISSYDHVIMMTLMRWFTHVVDRRSTMMRPQLLSLDRNVLSHHHSKREIE